MQQWSFSDLKIQVLILHILKLNLQLLLADIKILQPLSAPSTTSSSSRVNIIHRCALQKGHFTSQVTQPSAVLHPFSSFKELKQEELHAQLQLTSLETLLQGNLLHNLGSIWSTPCSCTSKKLSNMLQLKDSYTHTHTHTYTHAHTHTHNHHT